jgi:hypothetical protein
VIGFSWFAKNAVNKEVGLFLKTPLNKAIFFYILTCLVSTGFGVMAGRVDAKTGSLYVLKYIEYFYGGQSSEKHRPDQTLCILPVADLFYYGHYGNSPDSGGGESQRPI